MKIIINALIMIIFVSNVFAEEIFFGILSPIKLNSNTILIQNGSTPDLQKEIIKERRMPEKNLMEELETELIEIHASQICA